MVLANDSHPKLQNRSAAAELARKTSALKQSSQDRLTILELLLIGRRATRPSAPLDLRSTTSLHA